MSDRDRQDDRSWDRCHNNHRHYGTNDGVELRQARRLVRVSPRTAERTWTKLWAYSYYDLADLFGVDRRTIQKVVGQGRLNPGNLHDVCNHWQTKRREPIPKLNAEEFVALRGRGSVEAWKRRWPKFDVFRCAAIDCREVLLERGLCQTHGGDRALVALSDDDHFMVWLGRYVPICQMIFGSNHPVQIQHIDGNTWNSHPDNLTLLDATQIRTKKNRWSYSYRELSNLFNLSEDGTRQAVSRGILNPASLDSITSFWLLRQNHSAI